MQAVTLCDLLLQLAYCIMMHVHASSMHCLTNLYLQHYHYLWLQNLLCDMACSSHVLLPDHSKK
jgi:hypothetical protein